MNRIRNLAAGALLLTAIVHVAQLVVARLAPATPIIVSFGIVYLFLSLFLFRNNKVAIYISAFLPLIGLVLATMGMLERPSPLGAFFIAADVVVVVCCLYLIFADKKPKQADSRTARQD